MWLDFLNGNDFEMRPSSRWAQLRSTRPTVSALSMYAGQTRYTCIGMCEVWHRRLPLDEQPPAQRVEFFFRWIDLSFFHVCCVRITIDIRQLGTVQRSRSASGGSRRSAAIAEHRGKMLSAQRSMTERAPELSTQT